MKTYWDVKEKDGNLILVHITYIQQTDHVHVDELPIPLYPDDLAVLLNRIKTIIQNTGKNYASCR